ncbi:hypothetical protein RSAG8_06746, partial [Rhizoctonia solani AG-8 WAC10335]
MPLRRTDEGAFARRNMDASDRRLAANRVSQNSLFGDYRVSASSLIFWFASSPVTDFERYIVSICPHGALDVNALW